jgi:hypothetical protein
MKTYMVPKDDQFHDVKMFLINLSEEPLKIPYTLFVTMDFISLKYMPHKTLLMIAAKLEIDHSKSRNLIEDIKANIKFE